ncbi:MAG: hypothetical protein AAF333_09675 [Planctomycetota bacterium]
MGYTHYWYRVPNLDPARFRVWVRDVRWLHDQLPEFTTTAGGHFKDRRLSIHGPDGRGKPVLNSTLIAFNGRNGGKSSLNDLDHETFYVPRRLKPMPHHTADDCGRYFEFCKTARKPYDLLVTAALIALKHHFPDVNVVSDGDASDWQEGLELSRHVLNYGELPFHVGRARQRER